MFKSSLKRDKSGKMIEFSSAVDAGLIRLPFIKGSNATPLLDSSNPINSAIYARWVMWEGTGTVDADLGPNSKNFTLQSGALWSTNSSKIAVSTNNGALTASLTDTPANALNNSGVRFTVFWCGSFTSLNQNETYLMDWGNNGLVMLYGYVSGKIELFSGDSNVRSGTALTPPDTNTHSYAYTYDGSNLCGYTDGLQMFSLPKSLVLSGDMASLALSQSVSGSNHNQSSHEHFAIWKRSLSPSEISQLSANPIVGINQK